MELKEVWELPSFLWSDYKFNDNAIFYACMLNDLDTVMKHINKTKWTLFELMVITIHGKKIEDDVFMFLLSRLSEEDMTKTFYSNLGVEHTLLSFYCFSILYRRDNKKVYEKIDSLIKKGSQIDQEVGLEKTALSYLVTDDYNLFIVRWMVELFDANPHKGHLLLNACNTISKEKHEARQKAEAEIRNGHFNGHFGAPSAENNAIIDCKPYENIKVYEYLLSLNLDVDYRNVETGLTPLLSVCSEGQYKKIQKLLKVGGYSKFSLNNKTNDDLDVWFWAKYYKYKFGWPAYAMQDILQKFKKEQTCYWTELMTEVGKDTKLQGTLLLQEVCGMLYDLKL